MGTKLSKDEALKSYQAALLARRKILKQKSNGLIQTTVIVRENGHIWQYDDVTVVIEEDIRGYDTFFNVSIHWEDAGLTMDEYHAIGLYGYYSSSFVKMEYDNFDDQLILHSDNDIKISIKIL